MGVALNPKAVYVSVILRELDVPVNVSSKDDRVAMQNAVYLAQTQGADIGYRFSWGSSGPYSSSLSQAYYLIDEFRPEYEGFYADEGFNAQLEPVKKLIDSKPACAVLNQWLEAVGTLDFMARVMARPMEESVGRCKLHKPEFAALFESARHSLIAHGFHG
jgi:uncharacterized protein YwgA